MPEINYTAPHPGADVSAQDDEATQPLQVLKPIEAEEE